MRRFTSVNAWILGQPGEQVIVDTGMPGEDTAGLWSRAEVAGEIAGVSALVCTHMHRDHSGQAGELTRCHDAPLFMTRPEYDRLVEESERPIALSRLRLRQFLQSLGLPPATVEDHSPIDYTMLHPAPSLHTALVEGMVLSVGDTEWEVLIGGGHSTAAASLFDARRSLLLSGDQLLPGLGPHVTVWSGAPDANPLADYFVYLDRVARLPEQTLALPGHGAPIPDAPAHAAMLRGTHEGRLERLLAGLTGAMSCAEIAPLAFSERAARRFSDLLPGMTLSLANYLWQAGHLRRHVDDGGVYRFEAVR